MPEQGFHFAAPWWLLGLLAVIPVAVWLARSAQRAKQGPVHLYADPHLLPHLTGFRELAAAEHWGRFGYWTIMWGLAVLAMAGPRWDYIDIRLFHPGNNLLVLLDISRSMQVMDVPPSRLGRAKQEIQDLLTLNRTARVGLIAFASVPHVISPITEDMNTINNTLPALDTDLVDLQGSRLLDALDRADILLSGLATDNSKTILIVSDGDFDEPGLGDRVRQLAQKNIKLLTLGIGTSEGASVPDRQGGTLLDRHLQPITSALNADELARLAEAGKGFYQEASFRQVDSETILEAVTRSPTVEGDPNAQTRIWHERFFWLLIPLLIMLLPAFRRSNAVVGR